MLCLSVFVVSGMLLSNRNLRLPHPSTSSHPSCKLCLNISRWQSQPANCTGTVTVRVNRSVSVPQPCLCCPCVSVRVREVSTSRFTCKFKLHLPLLGCTPPPWAPPLWLEGYIFWFGLGCAHFICFLLLWVMLVCLVISWPLQQLVLLWPVWLLRSLTVQWSRTLNTIWDHIAPLI